jgi:DNA polymerase V
MELYDRIVNKNLLIRRVNLVANHVTEEASVKKKSFEQLDLFTDYEELQRERQAEEKARQDEKNIQKTILDIKKRFGKNAIVKGMNLEEGATTIDRNKQIGGHKA